MDYAKPFAKVGKATFTVTLKDTEYSKTFEVSVKAADKTALNNAIAAAEKLTEDKYESGWDAFQAAFDAAKKVAADEDATPAQVADALAALQAARKALVKVDGEKPDPQELSTKPGPQEPAVKPSPNGKVDATETSGLSKTGCLDDGVRRGRGPAAGRRCRRGAAASPRRVRREPPSQDSGMSGWPPLRNRWRPSFPAGMS